MYVCIFIAFGANGYDHYYWTIHSITIEEIQINKVRSLKTHGRINYFRERNETRLWRLG